MRVANNLTTWANRVDEDADVSGKLPDSQKSEGKRALISRVLASQPQSAEAFLPYRARRKPTRRTGKTTEMNMVRVTVSFDWNNTIPTHTINMIHLVQKWGGRLLSDAKHQVEACIAGDVIVVDVPTQKLAQEFIRQLESAGFVASIDKSCNEPS